MRLVHVALFVTTLCPQAVRAEFALTGADRVVFFGDTLVQMQRFSRYVETFVRVRYPDLRTRFFNYGSLGQTAADGLRRLDDELVQLSPTVVVVVFGLYDPDRQAFDEGRLTEFRRNYVGIVAGVKKLDARLVLITPPRPAATHLRRLPEVDYTRVVGHYAQAVREIGAKHDIPVVDWFVSSSELYASTAANRPIRPRREELRPQSHLFHAVLAAQLLKLWQAEPIEVLIEVDWNSDAAVVSSGAIKIAKRTAKELTIELSGVSLPWDLRGVRPEELQAADWPGAELCNYVLKMNNVPEAGVELMLGGLGTSIDRDQLHSGINITGWRSMQWQNPSLSALLKHMSDMHRWNSKWRETRARRPKEPELTEAYETHLKTLKLYEEGTAQIIFGLPKTFDVALSFRVRPQEQSPAEGQQEPE